MAFLSEILHKPVTDPDGNRVGSLQDVIASMPSDFHHPMVVAIVVKTGKEAHNIPFTDLATLFAPAIPLNRPVGEIQFYTPGEKDIYLAQDVLDKQIIDTDDIRVVRVNDVQLIRVNNSVYASNVDIGTLGILRRIGLEKFAQRIISPFRRDLPQSFISWDDVEVLLHDQQMRLKVPGSKITDLHPADLANIISDMNQNQTAEFLGTLDLEQLADTLEEVEPEFQVSLVESMSDEKVADVLEEMSPDEAADLLAELPDERSESLLKLMEGEEAEDVRKLLSYPETSAGGIMTTDYAAVQPNLTAEGAIAYLRENSSDLEMIFYVYVIDPHNRLLGVFSLSDLILAKPDTFVSNIMHKRIVTVSVTDSQDKVAQQVAKYNLLAIPVVDEEDKLQGIVTADDALDKIIPTAWKKRLPRYFR
jgi:CBS domain-containing protein/sporulation protein YlmC with PRC-barrel domain